MSLYDGLSVETAPVPELLPSLLAFSTNEEFAEPPKPKKKSKKLPDDQAPPVVENKAKSEQTTTWSSSNMKLMASQMMRQQMAASKVRSAGRGSNQGRRRPAAGQSQISMAQRSMVSTEPTNLVEDDLAGEIQDEYDPLIPNNYEEIRKAEREKIHEAQIRDKEKRKAHNEHVVRADSDSDEEERQEKREKRKAQKRAVAVPPPSSFGPPPPPPHEPKPDEETQVVRSALEELSKLKAPKVNPYGKKNFKTSAVASNIMTKYGWQEGQGLGRASQGISTALAVEKTSFKGGKIVNVAAERDQVKEEEKKMVQNLTDIVKNPTKVILLENMVGAGEVDNDLQPEVIEECAKYGEVTNCLIYEIPEGASDDEAVRIFVEFSKKDSTIKAVIDLNGRFFGGRTIRASFYDEERFSQFDLAPQGQGQ